MRKYLYSFSKKCLLLAGILLLMFSSCRKDILDEVPLDFLSPENAYTTLEGMHQGIAGLHSNARNWILHIEPNESLPLFLYCIGTDLVFSGENPGAAASGCAAGDYRFWLLPTLNLDGRTWYYWTWNYKYIQDANVLIQAINDSDPGIWKDDAQRNAYLAEAMFFRAFSYRILVSTYGDVPLVKGVINSPKTDFVRAPKADIYKLMEEDLTFGVANLPVQGSEEEKGRITQGAAGHMLSEVYLCMGEYQKAVDAATKVIEGYNYALMTSRFGTRLGKDVLGDGDVFYDLFGYQNFDLPENTEGIWVVQVEPFIKGGGVNGSERAFGGRYYMMDVTPDGYKAFRGEFVDGQYTGFSDTLGRSPGWITPTNYLKYTIWESDWNNDIRNKENNIKRKYYYDAPGSMYDKQLVDFSLYPPGTRNSVRDTLDFIHPHWFKFSDPCHVLASFATSGHGRNYKDKYAIRLPETLLLRAEAYVHLDNYIAAAADINLIRNRAHATPVLPENVDLDYICDERARELYGEEFRVITLRRMGKLVERVRLYNDNPFFPGLNIQDYNDLWPIPQPQIDLNISSKMLQNPGY